MFRREQGKRPILKGILSKCKISDQIEDTLPLLSYFGVTYKENEYIKDIIGWFKSSIEFFNDGNLLQELNMTVAEIYDLKLLVLNMIQEMDLDIIDFRIEEKDEGNIEVLTTHKVNDNHIELSLADESSGTEKLFGVLLYIARSYYMGQPLSLMIWTLRYTSFY